MQLSVFYVLLIGFLLETTSAGGKKEKVHLKIHIPKIIKHHHHTKIVYVKKGGGDHKKKGGGHKKDHDDHDDHGHDDHDDHHEKKKVQVVIHKHEHNHKHKHDHGHKHGHKHSHKHDAKHSHKHDHKGNHKHQHTVKKDEGHGHDDHKSAYNYEPYFDNDGYHRSLKSLKSEQYEYEYDHDDERPDRFVVKSSYKVREKDPYDYTTRGYHHQYQYPPVSSALKFSPIDDQQFNTKPSDVDLFAPYTKSHENIKQYEDESDYHSEDLQQEYEKPQEYNQNYADYDYHAPSDSFKHSNYRMDGTSVDEYLRREYGGDDDASNLHKRKVPRH